MSTIITEFGAKIGYKQLENIKEAQKWGEKYYQQWAEKLNAAELILHHIEDNFAESNAILKINGNLELYCGYKSKEFNEYLDGNLEGNAKDWYCSRTASLITSLAFAPRIPENIVVYRVVNEQFIENLLEASKTGSKSLRINRFFSTSLTPEVVKSKEYMTSEYLLEILVDKDSVGAYVCDVNGCNRRLEQEVLFVPDKYLACLDKKPTKKYGKKVYRCHMISYIPRTLDEIVNRARL